MVGRLTVATMLQYMMLPAEVWVQVNIRGLFSATLDPSRGLAYLNLVVVQRLLTNFLYFVGDPFVSCVTDTGDNTATEPQVDGPTELANWAIAVIVVAAVLVLVAVIIGVAYSCKYCRRQRESHRPLTSGRFC